MGLLVLQKPHKSQWPEIWKQDNHTQSEKESTYRGENKY